MFKRLIQTDYKKRGLATIIIGSTALAILLFLSLTFVSGQGTTLFLDWHIKFLCSTERSTLIFPNEIYPSTYEECLVDFSVKWLFVLSILLIALGITDQFGLISRSETPGSRSE